MMNMENKQVQQGQDNIRKWRDWSELKAWELAALMQHHMVDPNHALHRDLGKGAYYLEDQNSNFYDEWAELKELIEKSDNKAYEKGEIKDLVHLIGHVNTLFTYFFTFIAAVNEREKEDGINLQASDAVDELAKMYNLVDFSLRKVPIQKVDGMYMEEYTFEYNFAQIIPYQALPDKYRNKTKTEKAKVQKPKCWQRILKYLYEDTENADGNAPTRQDEVGEIFRWLRGKNAEAYKVGAEKYMDNYTRCLEVLDTWWEKDENGRKLLERSGLMGEEPQAPQQTEETTEPTKSEPENAPPEDAEPEEKPVDSKPENDPPPETPDPLKKLLDELDANTFASEASGRIEQGVKQIIFTGAPGTGKTYAATLIARVMGYPDPYKLVQFHPSYDYTDFVEGLRPVQIGGENRFVKLDGSFKAFCRKVVKKGDPAKKYFFLIDEINRADLSKVFGELMFCLEADKRGPDNRVETQYQNLPTYDIEKARDLTPEEDVFHSGFFIPDNVIVIGTMNDIDRSVESMDFALRRRFDWMEAVVDEKMLKNALPRILKGIDDTEIDKLAKNIFNLNDTIEAEGRKYGLTRQHFISQGQFANLPDLTKELTNEEDKDAEADKSTKTLVETIKDYVWEYRLEPLLREYLRGEAEKDIDEFIGKCKAAFDREIRE